MASPYRLSGRQLRVALETAFRDLVETTRHTAGHRSLTLSEWRDLMKYVKPTLDELTADLMFDTARYGLMGPEGQLKPEAVQAALQSFIPSELFTQPQLELNFLD